jgi:hypothetical protein
MSARKRKQQFNLMESFWKGMCEAAQFPPEQLQAKATFFSGAQMVLKALDQACADPEHFPPDAVLRGLLDECEQFFNATLRDIHAANDSGKRQ